MSSTENVGRSSGSKADGDDKRWHQVDREQDCGAEEAHDPERHYPATGDPLFEATDVQGHEEGEHGPCRVRLRNRRFRPETIERDQRDCANEQGSREPLDSGQTNKPGAGSSGQVDQRRRPVDPHWPSLVVEGGTDRGPLHDQLAGQLRQSIATGDIAAGEKLPPARELAKSLGVNAHNAACVQALQDEGLLEVRRGRGTIVTGVAPCQANMVAIARELVHEARRAGLSDNKIRQLLEAQL